MRTIFKIIPSILVATAITAAAEDPFVSQPAGAQETASESTMSVAFAHVKHAVTNRLEIGLRLSHFTLVDDKRDSTVNGVRRGFLGSINELEADQDYTPYPFVRFFPTPYVGVEIGYDKVQAITRKWTTPGLDGLGDKSLDSDGTIVLEGPLVQVVGRYPNETIVTPYAGFGPVFYGTFLGEADFEHTAWWHYNFRAYDDPDYIDWVSRGSPPGPNGNIRRVIELSDTMGWVLSGGASVAIYKGLELEASVQYVWADVDAHYYIWRDGNMVINNGYYTFPMDHWSGQIGLNTLSDMNRGRTGSDQQDGKFSTPSGLMRLILLIYVLITTATAALLVTYYLRGGCHDVLILIKSGPWSNLHVTLMAAAVAWLLLGSILILLRRNWINADNLIPVVCFYLLAFLYLNMTRERPFFGDIGDYVKAAINVNDGQPLHPRYLYPPFLAMGLSLLTRYGSELAIDLFVLSNYISLLIFIPLLLASLTKYGVPRNTAALAVFILLSVNVPLLRTIGFGQVNLHVCNLILLGFLLYGRNLFLSALALSLAVHIKASPVVLILPFLFCRDWKWLSAFAGISAGILLLTGVVFGFHYYTDFLTNASNVYTANNMSYRDNSFDSFFRASYYILDLDIPKAKYPIAVAKVILLLASGVIAVRGVRNRSFSSDNGPQGILWNSGVPLLFLMTMLSPLVWEHHFIFICLPFLVLLKRASGASELALFFASYYLIYLLPAFDFYPFSYARLLGVILCYIMLWRASRRTAGGLSDFDRVEGCLASSLKAMSAAICSRDTTR